MRQLHALTKPLPLCKKSVACVTVINALSTLRVDAGEYGVQSVSFSPKGDIVAAGCWNGTVQLIDVATAEVTEG